jgi:hypothetical protein
VYVVLVNATEIQSVLDGDGRYRVVRDGVILGWITKWYETDAVNKTGIKRFSAKPMGLGMARHDCETYSSALGYLVGYHDG